jgi:protein SCO1/2
MSFSHERGLFDRGSLLVVVAALAAGLGLWSAQRLLRDDATAAAQAPAYPAGLVAARMFPQPRALPDYALEGADGPLGPSGLRGRWTLVFLGFTHCPDICPTTLAELAAASKAWEALPEARRPRVLFVSVDPERDTPQAAGEYARYFDPDFLAATAAEPALGEFVHALGMVYLKVPATGGGYSMDHSNVVVLIDPQGRQAGLIRPPLDAAAIGEDLRRLAEATR